MIVIPGEPVAKGRPRFTKNGGVYTPKKTLDAESDIGWALKAECREVDAVSRFSVSLEFWTKKRADIDNLAKLVLDAANGVIWADDSQVWALRALKVYGDPETRIAWDTIPPAPRTPEDKTAE